MEGPGQKKRDNVNASQAGKTCQFSKRCIDFGVTLV
jgi:hypothetical protein